MIKIMLRKFFIISTGLNNKKTKKLKLENVAIARHCNLRPPGLPPVPPAPPSGKFVMSENCTWSYLNVCKISTF